MVPTVDVPPTVPLTSQITAVLLVPDTVAENCCVLPSGTLALVGVTEIETGVVADADEIDTVALADAEL